MELQQLKLGDKVKLQLIQPQFKCSGRSNVTCFYRGKVTGYFDDNSIFIEFKYKGIKQNTIYSLKFEKFLDKEFKDIKII